MNKSKSDPVGERPTEIADIINRRLKRPSASQAPDKNNEPLATTAVGELRLLNPSEVKIVGERYRRHIEIEDLANSIRLNGQFVPILVRPEGTLVNGLRRLTACQSLGIPVLAHVVELPNADIAEIEEDRCREALLPYEMYLVTQAMRPRLENEAWARKILGKAADKARKKGRVDDLLADHVGISRGTLRKIREIYNGWNADPEKFDEVVNAMEKDRRIDKHYKAFRRLAAPAYEGPALTAVAIMDWQGVIATDAATAFATIQMLDLKQMVREDAILVLPSSVDSLPSAVALIAKTGAKMVAAIRGASSEEEIVLFGRFATAAEEDNRLVALQAALAEGLDTGKAFASIADPSTQAVINLADAVLVK